MQYVTKKTKKKEISILMLGDTNCGKTCIIRRLVEDEYVENDYLFNSLYNKDESSFKIEFRYQKLKHYSLRNEMSSDKELNQESPNIPLVSSEVLHNKKGGSITYDSDEKTSPEIEEISTHKFYKPQDDTKRKKKSKVAILNITELSLTTCNDFSRKREEDKHVDMIVVCYPVCSPGASNNVVVLWRNFIKVNYPQTPVVLVATKIDLRLDPDIIETLRVTGQSPVDQRKGQQISEMMNCLEFVECSAKISHGIYELFVCICMHYKKLKQVGLLSPQYIANPLKELLEHQPQDKNQTNIDSQDIIKAKLTC